jgi:hypothetical protein
MMERGAALKSLSSFYQGSSLLAGLIRLIDQQDFLSLVHLLWTRTFP